MPYKGNSAQLGTFIIIIIPTIIRSVVVDAAVVVCSMYRPLFCHVQMWH